MHIFDLLPSVCLVRQKIKKACLYKRHERKVSRSKIGFKCQTLEVLKTPSLFPQLTGCSLFYWFKSARSWSLRRPRTQLLSKMESSFTGMGEHLNNNKLYLQWTSCCGDAVQQQEPKFRCSKLVEMYPERPFFAKWILKIAE